MIYWKENKSLLNLQYKLQCFIKRSVIPINKEQAKSDANSNCNPSLFCYFGTSNLSTKVQPKPPFFLSEFASKAGNIEGNVYFSHFILNISHAYFLGLAWEKSRSNPVKKQLALSKFYQSQTEH